MPQCHLIIANGGTGARIASEVVAQFQDELGGLPDHVAIAVVDARSGPEDQVGSQNVFLVQRTHPINFPVEHARLMDPRNARSKVEYCRGWWPPHAEPDASVNFMKGCGAKRTNGRFFATFFDADVATAIEKAIQHLMTIDQAAGQQPTLNVYVCASLGNGTGGGSFMQVATIANDLASQSGLAPRITGIFVPSTTTAPAVKAHTDRLLTPRIGANGVAALVELQYELNRKESYQLREGGWTRHPRKGGGPLVHHGIHGTYRCDDTSHGAPFETCFLVDTQNRTAHVRDYNQVVAVAGRVLFSILSGADADYRFLDAQVAAAGPFGSVGFMRVRSPLREGRQYMTLRLRERLARRLRRPDTLASHPHLELVIGNQPPCEGTVEASVAYFVRTIAELEETDTTDQLLDRARAVLPPDPASSGLLGIPTTPRCGRHLRRDRVERYRCATERGRAPADDAGRASGCGAEVGSALPATAQGRRASCRRR
jgi:hypothetical protein